MTPPGAPPRLLSVDALRGLTVAAMVLVNNPGTWSAVYRPLQHAEWHGWTPTDMVFPFFLFVVGVSIALALGPALERGASGLPVRVLRRAAVIFALGLLLHALPFFPLATLRIPGVLQRIAVCYLLAALLVGATRGARGWRVQAVTAGALLVGYWLLMTKVAAPGQEAGDLSPDGNLAGYVDRLVLGSRHIWQATRVYDPEGILSTLPATATTLLGVLAGHWLRAGQVAGRAGAQIVGGLAVGGVAAAALGWLWGLSFPVNKPLWTSSYALLMAGLAALVLAACHWVIEVRGRRGCAAPFALLGVHALTLFFLSSLMAKVLFIVRVGAGGPRLQTWLFEHVFAPWASPVDASLAYALAYVLLWWALMWALDRSGLRLRV
ncbi:MAG TPA: heparan-alpha-glucosaminide N-acetyltransferase domain-containing protein [Candidatus Acidoferrum sp.]|nr:heparan-alpha-glucosaminide N-acetyltransferase domain-containing protein [Candidatus Acidoferrum sp.]